MSEIRKPVPREIIPEARSGRVKLSLTKEEISLSLLSSTHTDSIFPFSFLLEKRKISPSFSPFHFRFSIEISEYLARAEVVGKYRNIARASSTIFNFPRGPLVNTNGKEMELPASLLLSATRLLLLSQGSSFIRGKMIPLDFSPASRQSNIRGNILFERSRIRKPSQRKRERFLRLENGER